MTVVKGIVLWLFIHKKIKRPLFQLVAWVIFSRAWALALASALGFGLALWLRRFFALGLGALASISGFGAALLLWRFFVLALGRGL